MGTREAVEFDLDGLRALAGEAREFLMPLWEARHAELREEYARRGDGYPYATASGGMCVWTSIVMSRVLSEATGQCWKVVGGSPWPPRFDIGGLRDADGAWRGHHWVECGPYVVDVSGDQFGDDHVVVEKGRPARYHVNYTAREVRDHLRDAVLTSTRWIEAWRAREDPTASPAP